MAGAKKTGMLRWWLVRHAPVINPEGGIYGNRDLACDVSDGARFRALAAALPEGASWLVSPLKRTRMTAEAIRRAMIGGDTHPGSPLVEEPGLIEQDFGDWQGMSHDQIAKERPEESRRFWLAPADLAPPGGESFATVCARMSETLERQSIAHGSGDIIAVCHGGSIRAAVAHALDLSPTTALRLGVETLSLSRLDRYPDGAWGVATLNATR
jgi:alpha-ribazole phosphatase